MTANPVPPIPTIGPTTGYMQPMASSRFKPIDPLRVLRQNMHWLILTAVLAAVLAGGAYFALRQYMPRYSSMAQLRVELPMQGAFDLPGDRAARLQDIEPRVQSEIARLRSQEILRRALNRPDVQQTAWYQSFADSQGLIHLEAVRYELERRHLSVGMQRGSQLINISVRTPNSTDPQIIINGIIESYLQAVAADRHVQTGSLRRDLQRERDRLDRDIQQMRDRQTEFARDRQLVTLDQRQDTAQAELMGFTAKRTQLVTELDHAEEVYRGLQARFQAGAMEPTAQDIQFAESSQEVLTLTQQINQLRTRRDASAEMYGELHHNTRRLEHELRSTEARRKEVLDRKIREVQAMRAQMAQLQVETLKGQLNLLEPKIEELRIRVTDLNNIRREFEVMEQQVQDLIERRKLVEQRLDDIRVETERDVINVFRHAGPTEALMTFPKPEIVIPGVFVLIMGMVTGLIFLRELLDQRVKSPADVKLLANGELIGVIPSAEEDPSGNRLFDRVVEKHPTGLLAESFRQLRASVLNKMDRRGYKTLMVVGPQPGSGTSTVAQNLAASLAMNGKRVLMVDANFRRPSQHRLLGSGNDLGLADVLQNRGELQDAIATQDDPPMALLPTGSLHGARAELLDSQGFRNVLSQLEMDYDTIIIDAPPALLSSESQLLAKHVDAIVIVSRAEVDKRGMLERMLRQLDGQRADVLGLVLNGVRSSAGGYFRKSYRQFYHYQQTGNGDLRSKRDARVRQREQTTVDAD